MPTSRLASWRSAAPVAGAAGPLGVVVGAGAGGGLQGGEGLAVEGVAEPVVVHVPGHDGFLLPGLAGDRAGGGVVLAGLRRGVAVRVVAELCQHPGAEDRSQAGLGRDDLSVRVLTEMGVHLSLQGLDLLAEGGDHRDQRADHRGAGGGDRRRLGQLPGAQRGPDRCGFLADVAAAGALERSGDLRGGQLRRRGRVRGLGQQLQGVGGVQVLERRQRGGEEIPQCVTQPLDVCRVRSQISVLCARATTLTACAAGLSPATGRS